MGGSGASREGGQGGGWVWLFPGEHQVLAHFLGHMMWCFLGPHPSSAPVGREAPKPLSSHLGADDFAWEAGGGGHALIPHPFPFSASSLFSYAEMRPWEKGVQRSLFSRKVEVWRHRIRGWRTEISPLPILSSPPSQKCVGRGLHPLDTPSAGVV